MNTENTDTSFGKLGIRAFTASSAYPVAGAFATVRERTEHGTHTVAVLETNESGKTPLLSLPTPPKSLSLDPESTAPPYSLFDVEINKSGYYSTLSRDVAVYPDTVSVLPVNMIPLPDISESEKYPSDEIVEGGSDALPDL